MEKKKNLVSLFSKRKNKPEVHPGQDHQLTQPHSVFFFGQMVGLNLGPSVSEATILIPTKEASLVTDGWLLFIIIIFLKKSLVTFKMATKINDKCQ